MVLRTHAYQKIITKQENNNEYLFTVRTFLDKEVNNGILLPRQALAQYHRKIQIYLLHFE